jgi:hypothetical protein
MDPNLAKQIDELVSDRRKFNEFVYTSLEDAVSEINKRESDAQLKKYLETNLPSGRPSIFDRKRCAVLFRQVATPNYEFRRFISLIDGLEDYTPVIFEYFDDKFVDKNEFKYHLGMLAFYCGRGKKGGEKICLLNIIDFNKSRGRKISEINTIWGQPLTDFHHELFNAAYGNKKDVVLMSDVSLWFAQNGGGAALYYKKFLSLFLQNDILFENFMLDSKELSFTKEVFLPAFISILNETGHKPLIVALEPTEVESDVFWMCHPGEDMKTVEEKLNLSRSTV